MSEGTAGFPMATSDFRAFVRTAGLGLARSAHQRWDTGLPLVCEGYSAAFGGGGHGCSFPSARKAVVIIDFTTSYRNTEASKSVGPPPRIIGPIPVPTSLLVGTTVHNEWRFACDKGIVRPTQD